MPDILLKGVPDSLHRKLKTVAARHRRSMNREAIVLIEEALRQAEASVDLPGPLKGHFPLTPQFVERAKREGRAGRGREPHRTAALCHPKPEREQPKPASARRLSRAEPPQSGHDSGAERPAKVGRRSARRSKSDRFPME